MVHAKRHSTALRLDEEALAETVAAPTRRRHGVYYSPAFAVETVLERVAPLVPAREPLVVVDPSCGQGAFLAAAARRWPRAQLLGLELDAQSARGCTQRLPAATIVRGNALEGRALEKLLERVPPGSFELWLGNPPYNGTSPLLSDAKAYARLRALLKEPLLPGTSLRDDFAFFLLRAAERLEARPGALAFITSATLLDAFAHAPLRRELCRRLGLREVSELPEGTFRGTRVRTCFTVWTSPGPTHSVRFGERTFEPSGESHALRPEDARAAELDAQWSAAGEPLTTLIPISLPGLKTRFDELLVDDDPRALLERVDSFLRLSPAAFARAYRFEERLWPKLEALKASVGPLTVDPGKVRPFLRHRGPSAFCYLERALIPRGDHRFRGAYDPHAGAVKLVFNVNELPLHATVVEREGCVTAYQHSRFAPLWVPRCALKGGLAAAAKKPDDVRALNFSPRGAAWVRRVGDPVTALKKIEAFVRSDEVQRIWAPAYGTRRVLPVPFDAW